MNKAIGLGVGGLVVGIIAGIMIARLSMPKPVAEQSGMHDGPTEQASSVPEYSMQNTMQGMTTSLRGKAGAEFDKAFIEGMIAHHDGAIQMAQLALENAKRQEIKDMAKNIISAQTAEINQMKIWQQTWFK